MKNLSHTQQRFAVNRRYKVQNGERQKRSFINIVLWGKSAETLASYASKGLFLWSGELRTVVMKKMA